MYWLCGSSRLRKAAVLHHWIEFSHSTAETDLLISLSLSTNWCLSRETNESVFPLANSFYKSQHICLSSNKGMH